jgi:hypothetical protein
MNHENLPFCEWKSNREPPWSLYRLQDEPDAGRSKRAQSRRRPKDAGGSGLAIPILHSQVQQLYLLIAVISNSYMSGFVIWHHIFWCWPNRGRDGDPGGLERFSGHPLQRGSEVVPVLTLAHLDFHQGGSRSMLFSMAHPLPAYQQVEVVHPVRPHRRHIAELLGRF